MPRLYVRDGGPAERPHAPDPRRRGPGPLPGRFPPFCVELPARTDNYFTVGSGSYHRQIGFGLGNAAARRDNGSGTNGL